MGCRERGLRGTNGYGSSSNRRSLQTQDILARRCSIRKSRRKQEFAAISGDFSRRIPVKIPGQFTVAFNKARSQKESRPRYSIGANSQFALNLVHTQKAICKNPGRRDAAQLSLTSSRVRRPMLPILICCDRQRRSNPTDQPGCYASQANPPAQRVD